MISLFRNIANISKFVHISPYMYIGCFATTEWPKYYNDKFVLEVVSSIVYPRKMEPSQNPIISLLGVRFLRWQHTSPYLTQIFHTNKSDNDSQCAIQEGILYPKSVIADIITTYYTTFSVKIKSHEQAMVRCCFFSFTHRNCIHEKIATHNNVRTRYREWRALVWHCEGKKTN